MIGEELTYLRLTQLGNGHQRTYIGKVALLQVFKP